MDKYTILAVQNRRQLSQFIKFPWSIYEGDNNWCPPMEFDLRKGFDRNRNPFFVHSEAVYFLALKDGVVCGRIAAIVNNNHLRLHQDNTGFFGWFESIDDQLVANLLLKTASQWLSSQQLSTMRGPINFSMSQECGVLIDM